MGVSTEPVSVNRSLMVSFVSQQIDDDGAVYGTPGYMDPNSIVPKVSHK
jgi:hypothetical protein